MVSFSGCHNVNNSSEDLNQSQNASISTPDLIELARPFGGSKYKLGDKIDIQLKKTSDSIKVDSIILTSGNEIIGKTQNENFRTEWSTNNCRLGDIPIDAKVYASGKVVQVASTAVQILSDSKPVQYSYKIVKIYPHSRDYYTQGLIFENGFLYESDGLYTKSAIRKINLTTGEVVDVTNMDKSIFAEGIARYKDKIYQLSWREKTGFIYDKNTLELVSKFNYSVAEGWGLEFNGTDFIMTDGSNTLYFMEPEYFTQVDKIEVMDDKGPVENLNELELINGKLFANVYQKDIIVIINPHNGKVVGSIDFTGLLPSSDYIENTDVLNGIAWNPANNHIFITGKNWPKLFEITIEPKR